MRDATSILCVIITEKLLNSMNKLRLQRKIREWLDEDIGSGDMSTTFLPDEKLTAHIKTRQAGILAGIDVARMVFEELDREIIFLTGFSDGTRFESGDILATISGSTHTILTGERLALNLMAHLSGIATNTLQYVQALDGTGIRIVDTRKATPGMRELEKYAVRKGGGYNHRMGLYDAVMLKDNHIASLDNDISKALDNIRSNIPITAKIEIECDSVEQVKRFSKENIDIIMLDNMNTDDMQESIKAIKANNPNIKIEVSGNVTLANIKDKAIKGVDYISTSALVRAAYPVDLTLEILG